MNQNRPRQYLAAAINFICFALLLLLHYCGVFRIESLRANSVTLLPFLVAFSFFNEEWASTLTGMAVGVFMDSSASRFSFLHTVLFMIIGLSVSLIVHHLFNNNVRSAVALSIIWSIVYYLLRCVFFHIIGGSINDGIYYLMYYAFPSVIYTNLFIIPFYFLQKRLYKIKAG